ncbi:MAG: CDGSH-type Zn-finger protein [Saprospiraceae bacterium]|jgi:CDGSH-type Zn-finger protein
MSNEPKIAGTSPIRVELEAGKTYAWCSCGESTNQPFCDGSHKGTAFSPFVFVAEESKFCGMCTCKRTSNDYACDGTHKTL